MLTVSAYGLISAVQIGYRILIALWVETPIDKGGLGWVSTSTLGLTQGAGALITIFSSYSLIPYSSKKLGNLHACIVYLLVLIPLIILCSCVNFLEGNFFWMTIVILQGTIMALLTSYINLISIEISNSVSESVVGSANGLSQGIVAIFTGIAALGLAGVYAWTIELGFGFPLDYHLSFIILCVIIVANVFITWLTTQKPKGLEYRGIELSYNIDPDIFETDKKVI